MNTVCGCNKVSWSLFNWLELRGTHCCLVRDCSTDCLASFAAVIRVVT